MVLYMFGLLTTPFAHKGSLILVSSMKLFKDSGLISYMYFSFFQLMPTSYIQTKACVNSYIFPDNSNFCDFF